MSFLKDIRDIKQKVGAIADAVVLLVKAEKQARIFNQEWRGRLKKALKDNRTNSMWGGSGEAYWDSVADTVQDFLLAKRDSE